MWLCDSLFDITDFVKKTKLIELENKIPDISGLATKPALTAVKNKLPDFRSLSKKQTMTENMVSLKWNLLIIIKTNLWPLQSLIL